MSRPRYGRRKPGEDEAAPSVVGVRHGHREGRTLTGTFGKTRIAATAPQLTRRGRQDARMAGRFAARLQRRTRAADMIAGLIISRGPTPPRAAR